MKPSARLQKNQQLVPFDKRRLKASARSRLPVAKSGSIMWGYIFLPNLDANSLFAARTLAQALSEHVLRPHLTILLVSLQHTLRYFGSWDAIARLYHSQVQGLNAGVRPRLLLTDHLFAGLHFGLTHPDMEFAIADANNLVFRSHLSELSWSQWKDAGLFFSILLQLKQTELKELVQSISRFSESAATMRFTSPAVVPEDLSHDDLSRRFGPWAVVFWNMFNRPELSCGTVFKDLPQDLCAQDFITAHNECEEFSNEMSYPLSQLTDMIECCLKRLLKKVDAHNSLEQRFGIRDLKISVEVENGFRIEHTALLNEPITVFNKNTRIILDNIAAKMPHKGQEFQHPDEPSFYFKAFQIYKLTLEPLRISLCHGSQDGGLYNQRSPAPLKQIIQNMELKHVGSAFQVPLQANFSTEINQQNLSQGVDADAEKMKSTMSKSKQKTEPVSLFRYATQELPLHLIREKLPLKLVELMQGTDTPFTCIEYLESIENEDFYTLHTPHTPPLLLSCPSESLPEEALFSVKGIYEFSNNPLQERLF